LWTPTQAVARSNNPAPKYKVDMLWPKPLPERWVTGEVAGTCVDANDHVFTVNRGPQNANLTAKEDLVAQASPPVIEFDSEGNVVNSWGDLTILPNGLHGCYIDFQGNFWIAGNGDGIVQKYSHDGKQLLLQIGQRGKCGTRNSSFRFSAVDRLSSGVCGEIATRFAPSALIRGRISW
jgi:hypothetical protein